MKDKHNQKIHNFKTEFISFLSFQFEITNITEITDAETVYLNGKILYLTKTRELV